ncbi:hypothetical protein DYB32_001857 [Aphanomyces invadans]|uniref:Uncharacterized protein n=1 Tax=Aphanomyces invadans TaxID=157072 RepID=A0A3R7ADD2_9STRA|nr:hypothetical protein DYB32_001857 [Aphanomyces invadans]
MTATWCVQVPSVRIQSEHVLLKMIKRTIHTLADTGEFQAHLIRVNPVMEPDTYKWKDIDDHVPPMTKIQGFGLATLQAIDQELGSVEL